MSCLSHWSGGSENPLVSPDFLFSVVLLIQVTLIFCSYLLFREPHRLHPQESPMFPAITSPGALEVQRSKLSPRTLEMDNRRRISSSGGTELRRHVEVSAVPIAGES